MNTYSDTFGGGSTAVAALIGAMVSLPVAFVAGVVTSLVAALISAAAAARADPVQALQKGKYHVLSARESRTRILVAAV